MKTMKRPTTPTPRDDFSSESDWRPKTAQHHHNREILAFDSRKVTSQPSVSRGDGPSAPVSPTKSVGATRPPSPVVEHLMASKGLNVRGGRVAPRLARVGGERLEAQEAVIVRARGDRAGGAGDLRATHKGVEHRVCAGD